MLGRDTKWRQGSILDDESALELGFVDALDSGLRVVVISHDCDLPNEAETLVEVIVGVQVPEPNPMFASARNPRCLHLAFTSGTNELVHIELRHANRHAVNKEDFLKIQQGDANLTLSGDEKRALKQWLAARYGRPAFPNAFENRLRKKKGKKTVEQRIAKILEPASHHLVGLFFDLGEERTSELPDGTPYYLSISIVYDATEGGQNAREAAEQVSQELGSLFSDVYGSVDTATEIGLETCNPVADTYMTLSDLRKVDQWRLEYISLRDDSAGEFLPTGETPA